MYLDLHNMNLSWNQKSCCSKDLLLYPAVPELIPVFYAALWVQSSAASFWHFVVPSTIICNESKNCLSFCFSCVCVRCHSALKRRNFPLIFSKWRFVKKATNVTNYIWIFFKKSQFLNVWGNKYSTKSLELHLFLILEHCMCMCSE